MQAKEPAPPSASEQAISSLADTGAKAAELAADPLKAASDTEALKASVEDGVSQVEGTLSSTRDKLAELGLSSKQDQFEAASAQISAELYSVRQASANLKEDDPASYSALSEKIDSLLASPEPTVLSSNLSHLTDSNQPTPPTYGTSIAPAYLSGTPGLTPSSLPPEPGDGDLAETPDAPQTEEIIALATQLNHNPVAIYEWSEEQHRRRELPTARAKEQPGTLKEQAGNSTDTASLLIALMRASGIPARYVTGGDRAHLRSGNRLACHRYRIEDAPGPAGLRAASANRHHRRQDALSKLPAHPDLRRSLRQLRELSGSLRWRGLFQLDTPRHFPTRPMRSPLPRRTSFPPLVPHTTHPRNTSRVCQKTLSLPSSRQRSNLACGQYAHSHQRCNAHLKSIHQENLGLPSDLLLKLSHG